MFVANGSRDRESRITGIMDNPPRLPPHSPPRETDGSAPAGSDNAGRSDPFTAPDGLDARAGARPGESLQDAVARLLLPRRSDPPQTVRLRGYFMAAANSVLAIGLMVSCFALGALPAEALLQLTGGVLAAMLVFYVAFRTGLNLRARDPNLTVPQMAVATLVVLYAMYAADAGAAGVFLFLLLMIFLFGMLRLRTRGLLLYALLIVAGYTAVIALRWHFRPETPELASQLLQWVALAFTLPWFALMGAYISGLREQLRKSNSEQRQAIQAIRASESRLAQALRIAGLGSWTYDPLRKEVHWSEETCRIFGVDPARPAPVGDEFLQLVHEEDRQHYRELIRPARDEGRAFDSEYRIVAPGGQVRWLHVIGEPVVVDGLTTLVRGTVMDVTARKARETERKQFEQRQAMEHAVTRLLADAETVAEAMPKVIRTICETLGWDCGAHWHLDKRGQVLRCAETWSVATPEIREFAAFSSQQNLVPAAAGLIRRAWMTARPVWIADVASEPGFQRAPAALKAGIHGAFAFPITIGAEIAGAMEFFIRNVRQPDQALLRVLESIGLQIGQFIAGKAAQGQLQRLAHFDFLTGLPNRNLFNQLLAHAVAKARRNAAPLGILFIDLDGFKQVNDTYGHDAGDHLLVTFTQRLRQCLRKSDMVALNSGTGTAARLGGDEFVVLVDDMADPSELAAVATRILAVAAEPFDLAGPCGQVTASIGISVYPDDGSEIDDLIRAADNAMYDAKQAGKNAYRFFSPAVPRQASIQ